MSKRFILNIIVLLSIIGIFSCTKDGATVQVSNGKFLYVLTNGVDSNAVLTYQRSSSDGALSLISVTGTGGKGTGAALSSQGPITISNDRKWILAVNAASNTISALKITETGLKLTSTVPSRGIRPISITCFNNLVYVLHSNENGQIAGYKLSEAGVLTPIENTVKTLGTSATGPAQISFVLEGKMIVVTLKSVNKIIAYKLDANGVPGDLFTLESKSPTPYGFAVGKEGNIYVSEATQGVMSAYRVSLTGITSVAGPLATNQLSACWVGASPNGKYIYVVNAASNTVTGYNINTLSSFTLMQANGITAATGIKPIDIAISDDSMFAYVLNYEERSIRVFYITQTGGLEKIEDRFVIPAGSTGIAVK